MRSRWRWLCSLLVVAVLGACAGKRNALPNDGGGGSPSDYSGLEAPPPLPDSAAGTPDTRADAAAPKRDSAAPRRDSAVARDSTVDAPPPPSFGDVPKGHLHYTGIQWVAAKGIMDGCAPTASPPRFCPNDVLTRAQAAKTLVVAKHGQSFSYSKTPYFTDVPSTHWAFKYVQKLYELKITTGCGTNTFCPDDPTKRAHGAVFLVRLLYGNSFAYSNTPYFTDVPSTNSAFKFVQKLYEAKITQGCGASLFCPDRDTTRGEWATMLYRAKP